MILICLVVSGFGLMRLTAAPPSSGKPEAKRTALPPGTAADLPFRLVLSAEASAILISSGDNAPLTTATGTLPAAPVISLTVRWKNPPAAGEQRFAKLILEPAGKPTLTHIFDATGDIDDILELP